MIEINRFCPHNSNDVVLNDYAVSLKTDANIYPGHYYMLQIVHVIDDNTYSFFACYGGQVNKFTRTVIYEPLLTKENAIDLFKKKFKSKFGKDYDSNDIDINKSYKGNYMLDINGKGYK